MTLKKNEKRLLIVLSVVVVVFLFDQLVLSSGGKDSASTKKTLKDAGTQLAKSVTTLGKDAEANPTIEKSSLETKQFDSWGRDPFHSTKSSSIAQKLSGAKKKKVKAPQLQGFFWKRGKAFVLVDNVVLTEGEEKEGIRINKIRDKEVLCSKGGQSFTLFWRESP